MDLAADMDLEADMAADTVDITKRQSISDMVDMEVRKSNKKKQFATFFQPHSLGHEIESHHGSHGLETHVHEGGHGGHGSSYEGFGGSGHFNAQDFTGHGFGFDSSQEVHQHHDEPAKEEHAVSYQQHQIGSSSNIGAGYGNQGDFGESHSFSGQHGAQASSFSSGIGHAKKW